MSFQQASSHFCNQNTFNLQDWLTFIACWSLIKIFCQNKMLNISWFQNNKKSKARHVSLKDEMWSQNKMQNSITIWLTVHHHSWISFSGNICVWPSTFDQHVVLEMFGGQYSQWHPPLQAPLVPCSLTFRLASWNSCNCSIEMVEDPIMTSHLLYGLNHLKMVVAWDLSESGKSLESSRCWQINSHDNYSIEILATIPLKWPRTPPWHHISCLD